MFLLCQFPIGLPQYKNYEQVTYCCAQPEPEEISIDTGNVDTASFEDPDPTEGIQKLAAKMVR